MIIVAERNDCCAFLDASEFCTEMSQTRAVPRPFSKPKYLVKNSFHTSGTFILSNVNHVSLH